MPTHILYVYYLRRNKSGARSRADLVFLDLFLPWVGPICQHSLLANGQTIGGGAILPIISSWIEKNSLWQSVNVTLIFISWSHISFRYITCTTMFVASCCFQTHSRTARSSVTSSCPPFRTASTWLWTVVIAPPYTPPLSFKTKSPSVKLFLYQLISLQNIWFWLQY